MPVKLSHEVTLLAKISNRLAGTAVEQVFQLSIERFQLFPSVETNPGEKGFHLFFTVSFESMRGRSTLPMSGVYQPGADLGGEHSFSLDDSNSILAEPHQHQSEEKVLVQ